MHYIGLLFSLMPVILKVKCFHPNSMYGAVVALPFGDRRAVESHERVLGEANIIISVFERAKVPHVKCSFTLERADGMP